MLIKLLQVVDATMNLDLQGVDMVEYKRRACLTQRHIFGTPNRKL